jgi:hypothetical protein
MGPGQPAPTCRFCGVKHLRRNNATGVCRRCREGHACSICRSSVGRGNPCPACVALCHGIALAHAGDGLSRPPAAELAARIAHYQARAAAGLDLFAAPEPLPLAS